MESGRFTAFSKNAPFGKPGILRGDHGIRPYVGILPGSIGVAVFLVMNRRDSGGKT
jgi:hypothetical protein